LSIGPPRRFARPPRTGAGSGGGHPPDEFDQWLDRSLRDLFDERTGKALPPEVKALIEPKTRKARPAPPKRR
jgi:hypothetical protein